MINFLSPAKINLYLKILGKRDDGYHLIESVFVLINLFDIIKIETLPTNDIQLISTSSELNNDNNLIIQAAHLLQKETTCTQGANIILHKNIPMGAGLGGGSSNAATTLLALNSLWNTQVPLPRLINIGLRLGADIPFFILGQNALVTGIGEIINPTPIKKSYYTIVFPNIHISTKKIFESLALTQSKTTSIINGLGNPVVNELQATTFRLYPKLNEISQLLSRFGKPIMTGSGSAMFIETKSRQESLLIKEQLPKNLQAYCVETLAQHPLNGLK